MCYNALFLCAARQNQRNRSATRKGGGRQTNGRSMSNGASLNLSQGFNSQASQVKYFLNQLLIRLLCDITIRPHADSDKQIINKFFVL